MNRRLRLASLMAFAVWQGAAAAQAATVSFSLNLEFNDPQNFNSGGSWTVVAKADERGMAVASLQLEQLNFNPLTGFIGPAGFEIQESVQLFSVINIVDGDSPGSPTLDVGVVGGPFPTTYVDEPGLVVRPGYPDLGSFTGGVELVTGTFNPGSIPDWFGPALANVYVGSGGVGNVREADVLITVRYVPEPTAWCLCALGGAVILAARRRRLA
jgi:hypothetical protein